MILLAFNTIAQLLIFLVSYSFQSKFGKTEKLLLWFQSFGIDRLYDSAPCLLSGYFLCYSSIYWI